jgi:predicted nucleic acid-binding protein
MNRAGVLLDTGPLVALLSKNDSNHDRATRIFAECEPPLLCCDAVIAEACFLMRKVHRAGPAEIIALGRRGVFEIGLRLEEHWSQLEYLFQKYRDIPISLADSCLIRMAEIRNEPRILTFDSDFSVYRWSRNKKFEVLQASRHQPRSSRRP